MLPLQHNTHAQLFSVAQKLLGEKLFESLMRRTVFGQFAGGVDEEDAAKTCAKLSRKGISSVWQYSVEQDVRLAKKRIVQTIQYLVIVAERTEVPMIYGGRKLFIRNKTNTS